MATSHRTHSSRAARALARTSTLSYNQALDTIRRASRTPRPEEFTDPEFTASFISEHHRTGNGPVPVAKAAEADAVPTPEVVWAQDEKFPLFGGGWGNPGCDDCGELDAVVAVDGRYLCKTAAVQAGIGSEPADGNDAATNAGELDDVSESETTAERCTTCGEGTGDGEGYDGLCGNCADIAETTCSTCAGRIIDDPNGSVGVVVHDPDSGPPAGTGWDDMTSYDLDEDHSAHNAWDA